MVQPSSRTREVCTSPASWDNVGRTRTATVMARTRSMASSASGMSSRSIVQPLPLLAQTMPLRGGTVSAERSRKQASKSINGSPKSENTSSKYAGAHFSSHFRAASLALLTKCCKSWHAYTSTSAGNTCDAFAWGIGRPRGKCPFASSSRQRSSAPWMLASFIKDGPMSSRMYAWETILSLSAATTAREANVSVWRCFATWGCCII
mmetsp:Transcript_58432/g.169503  ORF Transcript_58432/g.169503 Transcript_58432/m.169503 type:complete len:206 (+) Transcript_58432:1176-1793(+)